MKLKPTEYNPEYHKYILELLNKAEKEYETVKLETEYIEAKNKAFLSEIEVNLIDTQGTPIGKAKSVALASKEWAKKMEDYYKITRWKLVKVKCEYNELRLELDHVDRGMSYNQTLVKKGIMDGGK